MSVKDQPIAEPATWRAKLGRPVAAARAWMRGNGWRRWAGIAALVSLIAGGPLVMLRARSQSRLREAAVERPTLPQALAALDRQSYSEARLLAEQVDRHRLNGADLGGPDYILGFVAAREADELWGAEKKNYFLLATRHLELAREHGFERALGPTGEFLLGKSLYLSGHVAESRPVLEHALEIGPQYATLIHRLLSAAYRRKPDADVERAVAHNREYLADSELPAGDREAGLLREAQMSWQLGEFDKCAATLDQIPAEAFIRPEVELLRGRLALRAARELKSHLSDTSSAADRLAVKNRFEGAIKILRRAQDDPLRDRAIRRSMYLIGVCLQEMEDSRAALAQYQRTRDVYLDSAEGLAAGLQEADLLIDLGRDEEALDAYRRILGAVPDSRPFANRWIAPAEFRARVLAAYQHFLEKAEYERAISLTERLSPLMPQPESMRLTGDTYRLWARSLLHSADKLPEPQGAETRSKARALYRQAGQVFGQLADIEFTTRSYPEDVWQSAESFLAGHQFTRAVKALDEYLKYELRRRRPLALVNLGEALLALDRVDDSLLALGECIEFYPNDAASFQARLWAAKAHAKKGDVAAAEALLRENLNGDRLTPESKEWRDSLFALGKLLAANGRHIEAIDLLEEAVARYPDSRQSIEASYLIAEACQQAAKVPQDKAATDSVETARIAHIKQANQFLETAITHYEQIEEVLNRRQEQTELSPLEKTLLRNSYFAVGSALVELGRYEEAIRAYSTATNRYQHDPEVLEAFAQIATCYRRLNKPREARGAVQQAKVVLERIKPDASFSEASIYSRREWKEILEWLGKL